MSVEQLEDVPEGEKEPLYFDVFDALLPGFEDSRKREMGNAVCEMFDVGDTWSDLEQVLLSTWGDDAVVYRAQVVMGAGVITYCPKYVPLIR